MYGTVQKIRNTTVIFSISFSISIFVIKKKNKYLFYTNNPIHSIHTRFKTNSHPPTANLTKFQKAVHHSAIKIFNNLPHNIKDLANKTDSTVLECFKEVFTLKFLL